MSALKPARVYTAADLLAHKPCDNTEHHWYTRIPALVGDGVTARQIAEYTDAPIADRRWILTRLLYAADPRQLVLWAVDCALSVRHMLTDKDARDAADCAIQTAAALAEGEATQEECRRAARAAYRAAYADRAAYAYAARAAARAADASAAASARYAADSAGYAAFAAAGAARAAAVASAAARADADSTEAAYNELTLSWLVERIEAVVARRAYRGCVVSAFGRRLPERVRTVRLTWGAHRFQVSLYDLGLHDTRGSTALGYRVTQDGRTVAEDMTPEGAVYGPLGHADDSDATMAAACHLIAHCAQHDTDDNPIEPSWDAEGLSDAADMRWVDL